MVVKKSNVRNTQYTQNLYTVNTRIHSMSLDLPHNWWLCCVYVVVQQFLSFVWLFFICIVRRDLLIRCASFEQFKGKNVIAPIHSTKQNRSIQCCCFLFSSRSVDTFMHLILCKTRACLPHKCLYTERLCIDTSIYLNMIRIVWFLCDCIAFDKSADCLRTRYSIHCNTLKCTHTLPNWEFYWNITIWTILWCCLSWVVFKFVHSWPIWKTNDSIALQAHSICCHVYTHYYVYMCCRCHHRYIFFLFCCKLLVDLLHVYNNEMHYFLFSNCYIYVSKSMDERYHHVYNNRLTIESCHTVSKESIRKLF